MPYRRCWWFPVLLVALGCGEARHQTLEVPVQVGYVAVDERVGAPVLVLEESNGRRTLPIWIGATEARSIAAEMDRERPPRPNTHDLATRLILGLHGTLERVVVTDLRSGIYYANIVLGSDGQEIEVDSRPSDAIAIGLRMQAPIYVRDALLEFKHPDLEAPAGREARHRPWLPAEPRGGFRTAALAVPSAVWQLPDARPATSLHRRN